MAPVALLLHVALELQLPGLTNRPPAHMLVLQSTATWLPFRQSVFLASVQFTLSLE